MPLLGKKVFHLAKPLVTIDPDGSVYYVKHTGECFQTKDEYSKRISLYNEKVWTCQCTGHINLTHEEAWKSEQDARQLLKKMYPEYLEKAVLEIVHHSTLPLDMLIDKSYVKINSMFFPGDHVQFKVKNGGRVIKGRVVNVDNSKDEETRLSPCSDKENSDSTDCNHNETSIRKYPPKLLPFKYNIRLLEEDKIISAVPAEDLVRYDRPPNKDMLRLFIRAHSLRQGTSSTSPWVVDAKLVRKYSLPNKMAGATSVNSVTKCDLSALPVTNGEDKKRRNSAEDVNVLRRKKLKLELMPINNQQGYSKIAKSVTNLSVLKEAEVKNGNGTEGEVSATVDKPRFLVVDMTPPVAKVSSKLSNSTVSLSSSSSSSRSSPELDHSYSTPKKKNSSTSNPKMPLVTSKKTVKKTSTSQVTQVIKTGQSKTNGKSATLKKNSTSTNLNGASEKSTKLEQSPEVKIIKSAKGNPVKDASKSSTNKRVNGDKSKSPSPRKKKMKQVTLFDMSAMKKNNPRVVLDKSEVMKKSVEKNSPRKSPSKTPNKTPVKMAAMSKTSEKKTGLTLLSATPKDKPKKPIKKLTPAQISMLVQRITSFLSSQQKTRNLTPLLDQLIASLTAHEVECLPELVKERLERRMKFREWKTKCAGLSKEERLQLLKEQRVIKRAQTIAQPVEKTVLKPLPQPHLVATPDGVPNELFGDVVMIVEFINCYCGLLMPNESYPVQTDLLLKAVGSGSEGFGYLSRILLILLQTLLQDRLAEDYKELGVRLSDLPINIHTTSELVRLCLRKHDENVDHDKYDETDEDEDVQEGVLSLLENGELYQLIPEEKLRILVGLCHRILNSYSVQEYMEQKQKNSVVLWKDLNEQKRLIASKMSEWKETKDEAKIVDTTNAESNKLGDADDKDNKNEADKPEESNKEETPSRPGLRTAKSRELAALEKKKADEKKMVESEKLSTLAKKELTEKKYLAAHLAAAIALRQIPLGYDRNHARYWLFSHGTSGLYLEKGWVTEHIDYEVKSKEITSQTDDDQEYDSEDEPLANLRKKSEDKDDSIPVVGQNLWFNYDNITEVEELMSCLNPSGTREGKLLAKLKKKMDDLNRSFNMRKSPVILKPSDGDRELVDAFKKELTETEVRVRKGLLGGVPNLSQWESKLEVASGLQDLIPCLLETQANVLPRFLRGIMKMEEVIEFSKSTDSNEVSGAKVQRWIDAVENCPTMSRLHVLLGVLDACILWEKSSENAKCKICRRKDEDLVLILCDNCNLAFHLFCLRPALTRVPDGEWICPACQPTSIRQSERAGKLQTRQNEDETQTAETTKTSDSSNERRLRSGTRTNLRSRPDKPAQWKDESSSSEAESEAAPSAGSESGSESETQADECCMCGGDEDVVRCSKCSLGYHTFCHLPPMHNKPRGNWVCNSCQVGKKPKSIQKARKRWQKWKNVPTDAALVSGTRRMSARLQNGGDGDNNDGDSVQQITTRLRQRIHDATTENSEGPKISTRQARALRRALERDD